MEVLAQAQEGAWEVYLHCALQNAGTNHLLTHSLVLALALARETMWIVAVYLRKGE